MISVEMHQDTFGKQWLDNKFKLCATSPTNASTIPNSSTCTAIGDMLDVHIKMK